MTDRPLPAIAPTGHLDIRKIHRSTDADEAVFSPGEIKKRQTSPGFRPPAFSGWPGQSATAKRKKDLSRNNV
jgi:hypothetical protein